MQRKQVGMLVSALLVIGLVVVEAIVIARVVSEYNIVHSGGDRITLKNRFPIDVNGEKRELDPGEYVMTTQGMHRISWLYTSAPLAIGAPIVVFGLAFALTRSFSKNETSPKTIAT